MLDLSFSWKPDTDLSIDALYHQALDIGSITSSQRWHDNWETVIEIGRWSDLQVRCVGRAPTQPQSLAVALAKAKWIASRLSDPETQPTGETNE